MSELLSKQTGKNLGMKWALLVVFCDRFLQINSQPPPGVSLPLDTSGISRDGELTYVKTFNGKNT